MGSSSTPAALVRARILSDWKRIYEGLGNRGGLWWTHGDFNAVVSEDEGSVGGGEIVGGLLSSTSQIYPSIPTTPPSTTKSSIATVWMA